MEGLVLNRKRCNGIGRYGNGRFVDENRVGIDGKRCERMGKNVRRLEVIGMKLEG